MALIQSANLGILEDEDVELEQDASPTTTSEIEIEGLAEMNFDEKSELLSELEEEFYTNHVKRTLVILSMWDDKPDLDSPSKFKSELASRGHFVKLVDLKFSKWVSRHEVIAKAYFQSQITKGAAKVIMQHWCTLQKLDDSIDAEGTSLKEIFGPELANLLSTAKNAEIELAIKKLIAEDDSTHSLCYFVDKIISVGRGKDGNGIPVHDVQQQLDSWTNKIKKHSKQQIAVSDNPIKAVSQLSELQTAIRILQSKLEEIELHTSTSLSELKAQEASS